MENKTSIAVTLKIIGTILILAAIFMSNAAGIEYALENTGPEHFRNVFTGLFGLIGIRLRRGGRKPDTCQHRITKW
jgi:hypothetical protein